VDTGEHWGALLTLSGSVTWQPHSFKWSQRGAQCGTHYFFFSLQATVMLYPCTISIGQAIAEVITFRVSRRRRKMYCGHVHPCVCVCVCVCLSAAACPHYCTDPDVTWESGRGCPLVVHYWADLQSVHGLCCYGNITRTQNVSEYRYMHGCTRSMPSYFS